VKEERFITVPARAREEIGELTYYLEQGLQSLRDITEHLRGSSGTVPSVLDELRDVMRLTEAASMRVLDETEALVDDGRAAARLLADVHARVSAADAEALAVPMRELGALVERSNTRAMEIMSALEFQDLTSQKVQRTFGVLAEVLVRLAKIQRLVNAGADKPIAPPPSKPIGQEGKTGQRLADELLLHFTAQMDV
jgi:chemotaxis regulatin CheY-phosphate phosphatase CheZ